MQLPRSVLDLVRGASSAALVLAVGCSTQAAPIHREPAARLVPAVQIAPPPAPPPVPPAVLVAAPPTPPTTTATTETAVPDAGTHRRRHPRDPFAGLLQPGVDPNDPNGGVLTGTGTIGGVGYVNNHANCGRG